MRLLRGGGTSGRALRFAAPLMLADAAESLLWVVDAYFIGRLGDAALAAVGVGGYLSWLWFVGSSLFMTGVLVYASQAYGAGERGLAGRAIGEGVVAGFLLGVPAAVAAYLLAPPLVSLVAGGAGPEVRSLAVEYFRVRSLGWPIVYAAMALDAGYRALERSRPIMASMLAGAAANALLDPLLIFGLGPFPAMGVAGAAAASVVAGIVTLSLLLAWLPRLPAPVRLSPPGRLSFEMARLGLPAMAERVAFVLGNVAYLGCVARCGERVLAAHTVGVRIESVAFLPLFSLGTAASSIVGQEVGAGRIRDAKRAGWEIAKLSVALGSGVAVVLAALAILAPGLFTDDPVTERLARDYLLIAAATQPSLAAIFTLSMAIRGAGNTVAPTVVNIAGVYAVRVGTSYALISISPPGLCAYAAWAGMVVDVIARSIVFTALYLLAFERLAKRLARA